MSWTEVFAQQIYSFLLKRHSVDGIYSLMLHNTLECLKKIIFLFVRLFFFLNNKTESSNQSHIDF